MDGEKSVGTKDRRSLQTAPCGPRGLVLAHHNNLLILLFSCFVVALESPGHGRGPIVPGSIQTQNRKTIDLFPKELTFHAGTLISCRPGGLTSGMASCLSGNRTDLILEDSGHFVSRRSQDWRLGH